MGSPADEEGRFDGEGPLHEVSIPKRLAVGRYPITFEEWDFASRQGMKKHQPDDRGWGRDRRPVINVSWEDAQAYIAWLRRKTGHDYRLLSEAEWEYCCRAGSARRYSFGDEAERLAEYAWYNRNSGNQTHPVGEKKPNAWGLCDMHGNVWEWCEDMWHDSYKGKPAELNETGAAWTTGDGSVRVLRGGSSCRGHAFSVTLNSPQFLRSAIRIRNSPDYRSYDLGFRVARTLTS
jgi:formylglycine-generating enzyme required for sulfatase activity